MSLVTRARALRRMSSLRAALSPSPGATLTPTPAATPGATLAPPPLAALSAGSTAAMSTAPGKGDVAVVGAGLAGLVCANKLADEGFQVSIFDLGRAYPGGRSATRRTAVHDLQFDHGCQFVKPHRQEVQQLVQQWEEQGLLAKWSARLGQLDARTGAVALKADLEATAAANTLSGASFFDIMSPGDVYVPHQSMDSICAKLLANPNLKHVGLNTQVQRLGQDAEGKWLLEGLVVKQRTKPSELQELPSRVPWNLGVFDAVVLASVMPMSAGSPASMDFRQAPLAAGAVQQLAGVQSHPLVALMLAFPSPLDLPFDGAAITHSPTISWLCNCSTKPGQQNKHGMHCYVAITTPEFAQELIGSERPLPRQTPEYCSQLAQPVWQALQQALVPVTGGRALPAPAFMTSHRWGAALPIKPWGIPCLVDVKSGLVAAGDFCLGAGVDNTLYSGLSAAQAVQDQLQ